MYTQKFFGVRSWFAIAAMLLALPFTVFANPPSVVTGIEASEQNGQVIVRWQKLPESERITFYRIFFASQSILGNNGQYDDFDFASGTETEHILSNVPKTTTLYVAVLAVNDRGEESAYFGEEATVTRTEDRGQGTGGTFPEVRSPKSEVLNPQRTNEGTFTLISAEALSSTGVLVTFSLPITLTEEQAPTAFDIQDGSGRTLSIARLILSGSTAILHTLPQEPLRVYQVRAQSVQGQRSDGTTIPLEGGQASALFTGFGDVSMVAISRSDIQNLRLRGEAMSDGQYVVEASWDVPGDGSTIAQSQVAQTVDHGRTFSIDQVLPSSARGVRIPGVPAGELGIRVRSLSTNGQLLPGSIAFIRLGGQQVMGPPTYQASLTQRPVHQTVKGKGKGMLPESGIGVISLLAFLGAAGGVAVMRRRKMA